MRTQQEYINEQKITVTDYEHYVENWVHEIKKPLSLMTLLLDNRKDEMSPLVHTRMLYVRDHTRQDIEQILYFSRLGATHKDYSFESLSILGTCREAVEDNLTLLEEAGFSIEYTENDYQVISDKNVYLGGSEMQLQNEIVKKHTPIKSLLIDWLIIFGTYLFIRIFFALFGLHQNIVLLGCCLAILPLDAAGEKQISLGNNEVVYYLNPDFLGNAQDETVTLLS